MQGKITSKTPADDNTKGVEIAVPLKYLCNFWRTLKMPLINCEINLILTWSADCVYFVCNWSNKTCNNRYKTLCSRCDFINSR